MPPTKREYKTYADFNSNLVRKQRLASILTSAKELLVEYEECDRKIADSLTGVHTDVMAAKNEIVELREARKVKIKQILKVALQKRYKSRAADIPEWSQVVDLFSDITEGEIDDSDKASGDEGDKELERLGRELGQSIDDMAEVKNKLLRAEERINVLVEELDAKTKDLAQCQNVTSLVGSSGHASSVSSPSSNLNQVTSVYKGGYKIDPNTPIFKSKQDENVDSWLFKIENQFTLQKIPRSDWLVAVCNYVEGTAFEICVRSNEAKDTWDKFRDTLITIFRPMFKPLNVRSKILKLRDIGGYDKYLHEFRYLSNQISDKDMGDKDKLSAFVAGLRPKTQAEIFLEITKNKISTLEDAILIASALEHAFKSRVSDVNNIQIKRTLGFRKNWTYIDKL